MKRFALVTALVLAVVPAFAQPGGGAPLPAEVKELIKKDTKEGAGKTAESGKAVNMQYNGWLYDPKAPEGKGKKFDSSYDRGGAPFGFIIGAGKVIKGWDQGVVGMKVGGKRKLTIPSDLGYGDTGSPPNIPGKAGLKFDVELIEVK